MSAFLAAMVLAVAAWSPHPAAATLASPVVTAVAPAVPRKIVPPDGIEELGPVLTAASAAVIDEASGVLLWGSRAYAVRPFASITKLLAALALLDRAPAWDARIVVALEDIPAEGNTILAAGDTVAARDLFRAMLIRSDNGAARALARHQGDAPALGEAMARSAQRLGLTSVRVTEPTGLDARNRGSAVDAARLLAAALREQEIATSLRTMRTALDAGRDGRRALDVWTTNQLLTDGRTHAFEVRGAKTGYLDEAGYNFVTEVARDGHAIVVAVLGSATHADRFRDAAILADWIFQHYAWDAASATSPVTP